MCDLSRKLLRIKRLFPKTFLAFFCQRSKLLLVPIEGYLVGEIHNREIYTMPTSEDCINQRWGEGDAAKGIFDIRAS
jgi:hypothetical protein